MRLLLVGSEYAGARTLARALIEWSRETMGAFVGVPDEYLVHDHFLMPKISHPPEFTDEEHEQILALSPRVKEMIQRHNIFYHIPFSTSGADSVMIGLHIEDNVYGPLYFDYLVDPDPDDPIMATRNMFEPWINQFAPETVLVLVKASPDAIRKRMAERPHKRGVLQNGDIELVLRRFEEGFHRSALPNKLVIDTTDSTVEESVAEFASQIGPFLTDRDRERMDGINAAGG
jgi:hypothetical protein